jgi:glycosyltransferase involved in cell wall biosynthesis
MRGFVGHAIVRPEHAVLIRGSGVDLNEFAASDEPAGAPVFLLPARMLRDKGVYEFAHAAAVVKRKHPDWRFLMAGGVDVGNPSSVSAAALRELEAGYGVEWLDHVSDMAGLLQSCHVVCLPTYREGLPKTLLEAAASRRAMIASDIPGCREVVTHRVNGLLVAPREVQPLVKAMLELGEDAVLRRRCGSAARAKAEAVFSVEDVVSHTFRVYQTLWPE